MKNGNAKIFYRLFSFLSDFTNGFKPFVKYKLIPGSLLIGLTVTSCKTKSNPNTTTSEEEHKQISLCYDIVGVDNEGVIDIGSIIEEKDKVYMNVEQPPQFPGGERELMKYIRDNLLQTFGTVHGLSGYERVVVRFVVNKQGEVANVEVLQNRGVDAACERVAIRIVESMPQWTPGKQNGEAVNVYYTLPVIFKLY